MERVLRRLAAITALVAAGGAGGCGHTCTGRIALLSVGDMDGRVIPERAQGPVLSGRDACKAGFDPYYLSEAVRDALKGTQYDTLVDVEVTTTTGLWVWSNAVQVKGVGISSTSLPKEGVDQ
jgi:hypothetical protein